MDISVLQHDNKNWINKFFFKMIDKLSSEGGYLSTRSLYLIGPAKTLEISIHSRRAYRRSDYCNL